MITVHALRDKIWNVLMEKRDNKYMKKRNCILLTVLCLVLLLTGCTETVSYTHLLGIGLERLTMRLLDEQNVRETALFPRDVTRLEP